MDDYEILDDIQILVEFCAGFNAPADSVIGATVARLQVYIETARRGCQSWTPEHGGEA